MAERKATNKYYPPDWDPSKGSINKYVGQHPLRERARKLDQGILVVRFEMPYNIWCGGCEKHIGKGVRYNAEKKKIGKYYSTPIYSFRMKCHLCNNWIEIHTDPKNTEYVIASGARRKEEEFEPEENGTIDLKDKEETERLNDPMYKLEHTNADVKKAAEVAPTITLMQELNDKYWKDPYAMSQTIRKRFREEKKIRLAEEAEGDKIREKHNLSVRILPELEDDVHEAKRMKFAKDAIKSEEEIKHDVFRSSIFKTGSAKPLPGEAKEPKKSTVFRQLAKAIAIKKAADDPFAIRK
ncbi:CWC16 protein [Zopfochytrium polystomum]|nr:CWC16 protein [Zopfochytrium polystomum]